MWIENGLELVPLLQSCKRLNIDGTDKREQSGFQSRGFSKTKNRKAFIIS